MHHQKGGVPVMVLTVSEKKVLRPSRPAVLPIAQQATQPTYSILSS